MNKQNTFNDFRFEGLDYKEASNKYLTKKYANYTEQPLKCIQFMIAGVENTLAIWRITNNEKN